jgi:hypothetical protein
MAGTIVADTIQADSTSTLVLKNGVANTPPTIQDSAGTQIGTFCRAWVNFDGTTNVGGFCTVRASFNVTSVADNGTGTYTVNITNAMPDANYSVVLGLNAATDAAFIKLGKSSGIGVPTTSAFQVNTTNFSAAYTDYPGVFAAIFR